MKTISTLIVVLFMVAPTMTYGGSATVKNNVTTSASSGGNTAVSGQVTEGKSSATVKVQTVVNGQTVQDIEETVTSSGGSVKVEKNLEYATTSASVTTEVRAEVSATSSPKLLPTSDREIEKPSVRMHIASATPATSTVATSSPRAQERFSIRQFFSEIIRNAFRLFKIW